MESSGLIDSHCHLDLKPLCNNVKKVLRNAQLKGVSRLITIGIDLKSSQKAVEFAKKFSGVFAAVGIHPHDAQKVDQASLVKIRQLLSKKKVVALGEIGLDYFKHYSPIDIQKRVFRAQLEIAIEEDVPVIIHARDSYEDVLKILKEYGISEAKSVIHCFSGNVEVARQALELGCFISITGVITFKNANNLRKVVKFVPLDRLFLETDAPFLAPEPFRGQVNEPAYLTEIAAAVAKIKGVSEEEIARCTTKNVEEFFNLSAH